MDKSINLDVLQSLKWRYATKKFIADKPLEASKLDTILKAANLAPTSSGLQPFNIVSISNQKVKKEILPIFKNQIQILDCSHLLIFAVWDNYTKQRIDEYVNRIKEIREENHSLLKGYMDRIEYLYTNRSQTINFNHTSRQAYIALGFCLETAALLKIDTAPIENFDSDHLDKYLGLDKKNLKSVVALCLGYRNEKEDWLVNLPKVRKQESSLIIEIN